MSKTFLIAGAVALAAAGGAFWMSRGPAMPPALSLAVQAQEATATSEAALIPDMVLGQAEAPIEVVEYASFTCPHCANFHDTAFQELKANYIETGKVKFIYREVYFDKFGLWAAMIARCGGAEKYFGISDMLFDSQRDWLASGEAAGIADSLRKIGLKAGLDAETVDACMADGEMAQALVAAYQTNATRDEINATPTFLINGEKYSNMAYEEFAKILDEKLAN